MMKTIGFIKDIDGRVVPKEFLENGERPNDLSIDEVERKRILDYLNNSERVYRVTWGLFDDENYIGPYMMVSDGEWIWTGHFGYYLKKLNFSMMTSEFLNHIREREYKISPLSKKQRGYIKIFIYLKLLQMSEKERGVIRQKAIDFGYDVTDL